MTPPTVYLRDIDDDVSNDSHSCVNRQTGQQTDKGQTDRETDRQMERQTHTGQRERPVYTERQTGSQKGRQIPNSTSHTEPVWGEVRGEGNL